MGERKGMSHKSFLDAIKREGRSCVWQWRRERVREEQTVTCPVKIYGSGGLTIAGMWALWVVTLYRSAGGHVFWTDKWRALNDMAMGEWVRFKGWAKNAVRWLEPESRHKAFQILNIKRLCNCLIYCSKYIFN